MVALEQHLYLAIVLPRKLATGSINNYLFCYSPLVGILFEVLKIELDYFIQFFVYLITSH